MTRTASKAALGDSAMTNEQNAVSNWTMATGTKPGERHVYRNMPSTPTTHSASDAKSLTRIDIGEKRA
jgi:hypothetical protein